MLELLWINIATRNKIYLKEEIETTLKMEPVATNPVVHVGTDAQKKERNMRFTTAVVIHRAGQNGEPGKGARGFSTTQTMPAIEIPTLRSKLFQETWFSLQAAMELDEFLDESVEIVIHVDANTNARWESHAYLQELVGMVVGQGFAYRAKPDAWCASHTADHVVKGKHIR